MKPSDIPKAIPWRKLLLFGTIAVVAILIGAGLAKPVRATVATVGHWIGFGHRHDENATAVSDDSGTVQYYTCGMHPWVILPAPGDCPICHMELTPIDPSKFSGEVTIDPVVVQNMGVRVEPVVSGPLTKTIRTVGTVDYNERTVRDVNVKVSGWIEKLDVDFLGAQVNQGDPLFELYSPQLYSAQNEYLLAWRKKDRNESSAKMFDSARTRLEYYDITDRQLATLQDAGEPAKTMTIRSPHSGVVIAKHANEGMKVDPGMQVFRIADLSKVWVLVTLYEYQLPYVEKGMKATMSLPYIPGQTFEGEVIYVYPYLEKKTREVQVRLEFENSDNLLKPGMFANVQLTNTLAAEKTLVSRTAVIDTGERQVAFVSHGEGKFEPRQLRLGVATGDGMVEVISGLKPGEMVVTSGQFLIDSEAKIREALAKMIRGDMAADQQVSAEEAGASELDELPEPVADTLDAALDEYLTITDTLASDGIDGVADAAGRLAQQLDQLSKLEIPSEPHFWHKHQESLAGARSGSFKLAQAADLAAARLDFAEVSTHFESLLMATGVPPSFDREVQVLHCPMYRNDQGGTIWLQPAGDVRNPYFGSTMLECFDERNALPVTGVAADAPASDAMAEPATPAPAQLAPAEQDALDEIVGRYLAIQQALTEDRWKESADDLAGIREQARILEASGDSALSGKGSSLQRSATIEGDDIAGFREGFATLSDALLELVREHPPGADKVPSLYQAYCPMVKKNWLQASEGIRNPYDPSMLECGSIKADLGSESGDQGETDQ
ncbi:efflux RND transporter periplasmic adaptor subunit [Haloferula sargassicola]|uniref:Efflux RND transporter periplasmic adaptor subunit n=1 Tax=Haloferula sargassicola TaxID=490096 RepID=A0ABP9UQY7_9BACT